MKEKNTGSIVLNVVLVILLIVILVVVGMYIYNLVIDNNNSASNSATNNSSVANVLSDEQALTLVKEKYAKASDAFWLRNDMKTGTDMFLQDDKQLYEITNYKNVTDNLFTTNGKAQLEKYLEGILVEIDGKYYIPNGGGKGSNIYYRGTEYTKVSIEENKIVYSAKSKYVDDDRNTTEFKENNFVLVKNDDNWLVDDFTLPD